MKFLIVFIIFFIAASVFASTFYKYNKCYCSIYRPAFTLSDYYGTYVSDFYLGNVCSVVFVKVYSQEYGPEWNDKALGDYGCTSGTELINNISNCNKLIKKLPECI